MKQIIISALFLVSSLSCEAQNLQKVTLNTNGANSFVINNTEKRGLTRQVYPRNSAFIIIGADSMTVGIFNIYTNDWIIRPIADSNYIDGVLEYQYQQSSLGAMSIDSFYKAYMVK